jgi:hypothetical protein
MTTWAGIVEQQAIDVTVIDPTEIFFSTIAAQFVVVPDGTLPGDTLVGGVWSRPAYDWPPGQPVVIGLSQ